MSFTTIEIASYVTDNIGMPVNESQRLVKSIVEIIKNALAKGKEVMISGFGRWSVREKKAGNGRNPQTGEPLKIDARKAVNFQSSNKLRQAMKGDF